MYEEIPATCGTRLGIKDLMIDSFLAIVFSEKRLSFFINKKVENRWRVERMYPTS
ncbi:hypothetical protein ABI013_12415 [Enterococcus faecium]|uniref:Uncharacterized protein n=1 Tax=Enterococcus faecium TaxID=1352 RepID=A0A6A8NK78_ENTFC|nr:MULTISPECIES: hypothetical protein [Enterococcus]EJC3740903.1 hypothetical protein [Enterococcus faecium]EKY8177360.1 hypothetical protein [Enterococcus faecium]MBD9709272.1 hypothetical protein [Enterococcus faecium]MBT1019223.1 hypothetical protein [Enterococcus faecium]MBT1039971.1 hypothetical protein [Enterococcus faecium]